MKINYLVIIYVCLSCQFLFAGTPGDISVEIILQNHLSQSLDQILMYDLIPNGLGFNLRKEDWTGSISYGYNSYFIQNPAMTIGLFKKTHTIIGKVGILTSANRITGIEHDFQDNVKDKDKTKVYRKMYHYVMTEIGFAGREFSVRQIVGFEGSIRLGIIHELSGLAYITKYGRTPLKLWINIGNFRPGISWDYIVHDLMESWDVDNVTLFMVYTL
ncbi:hypothetical protein KKC74_15365 [bacterium]|nr:hypothetical protein [bacterium]MBU1066166.1 hypothetical protein [bacterium]MBU1873455.1 hypothetical protein [bacterium]